MIEYLKSIVEDCNNYIKDYPFLSLILFGILTNILSDIVKLAFARSVTSSITFSKFLSKKLILNGIKGYEIQLKEIEDYRKDPLKKIGFYLGNLYENFFYFVFIVVSLYVIRNVSNDEVFLWSFYGASANIMFRICFGTFIYMGTLDNLLNRIDEYEVKTKSILQKLEAVKESKISVDQK